jgi:hypothetical protein
MQRTVHAGLLFDLRGRLAAFQSAFDKEAGRLPGAERLLVMATRALALTAIRHTLKSFECGWPLAEPTEDYKNFARSLYPAVIDTKEWRALNEHEQKGRSQMYVILARSINDIQSRITWRRWRRSGVYHHLP